MAMVVGYRVDVLHREIAREFLRGGRAERWLDRLRRNMHRRAVAAAPARSGDLARSHRSDMHGYNQYRCQATIYNTAEYAEFVHDGRPSQRATGKKRMILPPGGPGRNTVSPYRGQTFSAKALKRVRAQGANPWLEDVCTQVSIMQGGAVRIA